MVDVPYINYGLMPVYHEQIKGAITKRLLTLQGYNKEKWF
jgi:hypothetical protein